jgi:uncharacterized damage-inducible protein DinB
MTNSAIAEPGLPDDPAYVADERQTLTEFLDYYRAVLVRKASGLTQAQLAVRLGPGILTLGGLLKHMAYVEDWWFHEGWAGRPSVEPWASVDWATQPDWDIESAADDTPDAIADLYTAAIARSRAVLADSSDLDAIATIGRRTCSLRWILVHMIEEYARHCGHADLIRESIDGRTGD